jgi:Fe-S cluster assembly iron-binding protein IscA
VLRLTRAAHHVIRDLGSHSALPGRAGLRISLDQRRQQLVVRSAGRPAAGDHVTDIDGARLFVGRMAAPRLRGGALHVRRDERGRWQFGVLRRARDTAAQ